MYQNPRRKKKLEKRIDRYQKSIIQILTKQTNAEEKFKEATEAYEVLSDETKKANYDQFGHSGPNQGFGGGGFGGDGFGFEDIFSSFFGGNTRRRDPNAPRKGNDLQYTMTIDFMEAVFGKKTEIEIPKEETCDTCNGSGAKKGHLHQHVNIVAGPVKLALPRKHLLEEW